MSTNKRVFSSDFLHGFATSAVQTEGGSREGGKGSSVWDRYCREGLIFDKSTCDHAAESYKVWESDIDLLAELGANSYRFSISWPRIIPDGSRHGIVNDEGLAFYSRIIDRLLERHIVPVVTIFHWDTPEALDVKYGAWRNPEEISEDFVFYANVLFQAFGDRVKNWITINEPIAINFFANLGLYKDWTPSIDNWKSAYAMIKSHAKVSHLYRTKYQPGQKGRIGITISSDWVVPIDDSEEAKLMAQRKLDYFFGVFADPIYLGDWPESLKKDLGERLPGLTANDKLMLKDSCDYFCLNSYSASWALPDAPTDDASNPFKDLFGNTNDTHHHPVTGQPIGNPGQPFFLFDVPWAFRKMLHYIQERYLEPCGIPLFITENGFAVKDEQDKAKADCLADTERVNYFKGYLAQLASAVSEDGLQCCGYMAWTLMDNWEWKMGWACRYGVSWVDPVTKERVPKDSAKVIKAFFAQTIKDEEVA